MASDILIKFEGGTIPIKGESLIVGFEEWLEVFSFQEGFSNPMDPTGKGAVASRTNVSDITISSVASQHSNWLKLSMFKNNCFSKITVSFIKQIDDKPTAYDIREYTNAYITGYSCGKSSENPANEHWTFVAMQVADHYSVQDPASHQLTEASNSTIDVAASTAA
jgi:type VI protein secretion system component Hcp